MRNITRSNYTPHIGDYHNKIVHDPVLGKIWLFDCDGVFLDMSKTNVTVVDEFGPSESYAASQRLVTEVKTLAEGFDEASHLRDDELDDKIVGVAEGLNEKIDANDVATRGREQALRDDYTNKYQTLDNDIETLTRVTDGLTTDVEQIERTAVFGAVLNQSDQTKIDLVVNDGGVSTTTTIRNANNVQNGLMTAADHNQIAANADAIQHLQNAGLYRGSFPTIADAPTTTPDPAFVGGEIFNNDYISVQEATYQGETGSARYRAFVDENNNVTYAFEIFIDKDILNFTTGNPGLIVGGTADGSVAANQDGTGSVVGWNTVKNDIQDNADAIEGNTQDIAALTTRVGTAEGTISSQGQAIANNTGNISDLATRMTTAEGNVATNTNGISAINNKGVQATTDTTLGANTENLLTVKGMLRQWVDITNSGLPASPDPDVFYYTVEA